MQGHSGAAARSSGESAGAQSLRLLINPPRLRLDDRTVIFKYTGDGGWFCASFGEGAKYMQAAQDDRALRERIAQRARNIRSGRTALGPDLARVMAAVELSKDYDPDQPRDEQGRWSREGAAAAAAAGAAAGFAGNPDAFNLYGAPSAAAGLRALAQRALAAAAAVLPEGAATVGLAAAGAAAVLGTLFLPTNRAAVATGTLPDAPEFSYKYDQDTGRLTVTRQNPDGTTDTVFSGHHDKDAVFRDQNGNAIGRYLGDSVALDADAVRGYQAPGPATTRDDDPKVCPTPEKDKPGGKTNEGGVAYEEYVGEVVHGVVPPKQGLAIRMTKPAGGSVYLDNCVNETRTLIEAKGFNYGVALEKMKTKEDHFPWDWYEEDMMDQAARQVEVARARGWNLEWHFADKEIAKYMEGKFAEKGYPIKVVHTQPPQSLTDRFGRVLEGLTDERTYLLGLPSWQGRAAIQARGL